MVTRGMHFALSRASGYICTLKLENEGLQSQTTFEQPIHTRSTHRCSGHILRENVPYWINTRKLARKGSEYFNNICTQPHKCDRLCECVFQGYSCQKQKCHCRRNAEMLMQDKLKLLHTCALTMAKKKNTTSKFRRDTHSKDATKTSVFEVDHLHMLHSKCLSLRVAWLYCTYARDAIL